MQRRVRRGWKVAGSYHTCMTTLPSLLPRQRTCTLLCRVGTLFLWLFFFSRYLSVQTRSTVTVARLFPPHSLCLMCCVCFVYDTKRLNKKMNECVVGVYIAVKNKAAWFQKDEDVSRLAEMFLFFFQFNQFQSALVFQLRWRWKHYCLFSFQAKASQQLLWPFFNRLDPSECSLCISYSFNGNVLFIIIYKQPKH